MVKNLGAAVVLSIALIFAFMGYVVLVYPEERAKELETKGNFVTIKIEDGNFNPNKIEIEKGTKVKWVNYDKVKHKIVGVGFESDILNYGESYFYEFGKEGVYEYSCEFYPGMYGKVIVR